LASFWRASRRIRSAKRPRAGAPTTDPAAAIDGIILPMAGHKGYAIAAMMDMLSGVLSGSSFGGGVAGPYQTERKSGAGHLMIVLNIATFQPMAEFEARMEAMIHELKNVPLAVGHDEVFYPGEIEARNRRDGLILPDDTVRDLWRVAAECGVAFPRK
jgi:LDH2 family malate/lactate/ureidoglycolate dehydrogenase